jgi:Leucine-rich repeat (LRR) protein
MVGREKKILEDLQRLIHKPIPPMHYLNWKTLGVELESNRITGLGLYHSALTTLPISIGQLSSLRTLYLGSNKLTTLPESIGQLQSLQVLDLFNNQITTLPESFNQLSNLQYLDLRGNPLDSTSKKIADQFKAKMETEKPRGKSGEPHPNLKLPHPNLLSLLEFGPLFLELVAVEMVLG